nr:MAG TPA: WHSC1L1 protein-like protein [Caudoviricetes sp.]
MPDNTSATAKAAALFFISREDRVLPRGEFEVVRLYPWWPPH